MKSFGLKITLIAVISAMLAGCAVQPFKPKALNPEAKGIATVRSTPYGCQVLGEVEGKEVFDTAKVFEIKRPTLLEARDGALNDLRNNTVDVVGNNAKCTVLYIFIVKE